MKDGGYILLSGQIYVLTSQYKEKKCYIYTISTDDLTARLVSAVEIPELNVAFSTISTYHSQLVLIGGKNVEGDDVNSAYVSSDGINWQPSLPPMPTRRHWVIAVNIGGSPECLVVAGGFQGQCPGVPALQVEVLLENVWYTVDPLPFRCNYSVSRSSLLTYLYSAPWQPFLHDE